MGDDAAELLENLPLIRWSSVGEERAVRWALLVGEL